MSGAGHGLHAGEAAAPAPVRVFLSAGSNIDPERHLRRAVAALRERFGPLSLSSVYRSSAAGFAGEDFLNLVIGFTTREPPQAILAELDRLHREAARVRGDNAFSSRTLDLDLILYGDQVIEEMRVPRPDILEYSFVLGPLAEVAPELRHPVSGETIGDLWQRFDRSRHPIHRLPVAVG
jgi:2-amino-4-hydroxy-6-hydroxymethyldihydropteridine diphosphokinase